MLAALLMVLASASSSAHAGPFPAQLKVDSFAACLRAVQPVGDLQELRRKYRFGASDFLLLYLSVYPGVRSPDPFLGEFQAVAHDRWSTRFEAVEEQLAYWLWLQPNPEIYPADLWREGTRLCPRDAFCAAISAHNVLRTLGRHAQAGGRLSGWFRANSAEWIGRRHHIRSRLISLLRSGRSERYGEWYHFFGFLTMAIREATLRPAIPLTALAPLGNAFANPLFASGFVPPDRLRMDQDSVAVVWSYLFSSSLPRSEFCDQRSGYVF